MKGLVALPLKGRPPEYKFWSQTPAVLLRDSVSLGKSFNFSDLRFSSYQMEGDNKDPYFLGLLYGLNTIVNTSESKLQR